MIDPTAADEMAVLTAELKQWAEDQIGKHTGPMKIGPGVTVLDPDKFIRKQLTTMEANKPRSILHTSSYWHLLKFQQYIATIK